MPIKYVPSGDKFKASQLWGEGRHQLSILKNLMSFQNLQQDQRIVRFKDGTIIKCLSCFAQDVIEVFVPLIPIGVAPRYEVVVKSSYWPAFEAYDGAGTGTNFLGVVLCKGGGFNPPYEFVSKDSLPADLSYSQNEELFSERFWEFFDGDMIGGSHGGTSYQDIVPSGLAKAKLIQTSGAAVDYTLSGSNSVMHRARRDWYNGAPIYCDCWHYYGASAAQFAYTRTQNRRFEYGFCYRLPGDPYLDDWPDYTYEGVVRHDGEKSNGRDLTLPESLYYENDGGGTNNFIGQQFATVSCYAMKFVGGVWIPDDTVCNYATIAADAQAQVDYGVINSLLAQYTLDDKFEKMHDFFMEGLGACDYSLDKNQYSIWDYAGSVLDGDHYALVYSIDASSYHNTYIAERPADLSECIDLPGDACPASCYDNVDTVISSITLEGPLNVVVDGKVFEVADNSDNPTLQEKKVKYFKVNDELSIGMFCIAKNQASPYDYMYVYAKVTPDEQELVITPVDAHNHLIPDVTGDDDEDLYGHWNFRLILETITTITKVAEWVQ